VCSGHGAQPGARAGSSEGEAALSGGRLAARVRARRQSGTPEQAARAPKRNPQARARARRRPGCPRAMREPHAAGERSSEEAALRSDSHRVLLL